jgi:hypothetical protein
MPTLFDMSFVVCPLCGRMVSLRTFNPQSLDLDVYVQNVKGLGRGRGFKVVEKSSALGVPSVTRPIKGRVLDLSMMLYKEGLLSKEEVAERFGLLSPKDREVLEDERDALRADLEETEGRLKDAEGKHVKVKHELGEANEGFSDRMNELTDLIAEALEEDIADWEVRVGEDEDEAYATLRYGLERLIDDYGALEAMQEES